MTTTRCCALAAALTIATAASAQSQFWSELKAGAHPVGFRALYQLDWARSYDADYPIPGSSPLHKPRPIFLAIWYPAAAPHDVAMVYRDYFRVLTEGSPVPEFAQRLRKFTRDMACEYMLGKTFDKLTDGERVAWDGLLATPVFATRDVPAAAGKFPVVIYHPGLGGTFEDNSVACEYLASHGYVVVTSAYQAADSSILNIDGDLATSLQDLAFLLRYAATLPFADVSHVAAIGHSYGSQAMMAWRALPNSPLDAAVFLDSTVEYRPIDQFADLKAALERSRESACPVALFADRRRRPHFETFDRYLRFAPRYEATVDGLDHNDFVSQGAIGKDDSVHAKYQALCEAILRFLDAHLKSDAEALKSLRDPTPAGPLQWDYKPPLAAPPTSAQAARLYCSESPANLAALAALMKESDADLIVDAASLLMESGRTREAASLLHWAAPLMPQWADLQRALGEVLLAVGDKAGSRAAFEKALLLLPDDGSLDAGQKADCRKAVEEGLKALLKN